jgi:hypothetical protein
LESRGISREMVEKVEDMGVLSRMKNKDLGTDIGR